MDNDNITIYFLGAVGTVIGSKYLVDTGEWKIVIYCGLFQGLKKLRLLNWDSLPVNVEEMDTVLLTHGHMDHTGFLIRQVKMGINKTIQRTAHSLGIGKIILRGSAKIQEEEEKKANREGYSKHCPDKPMYDLKDVEKAIAHFMQVPEGEWQELFEGIQARFQYNGHIIGATFIELDIHGKRFVFSGDIGRKEDLLMKPNKKPEKTNVLFIESTYEDRLHLKEDLETKLKEIILHTVKKGGTLIIPSFVVVSTQTLMYLLWQLQLQEKKAIPKIPLIMDSPMGANVLKVFHPHREWHKLTIGDCTKMCNRFRVLKEFKETWEVIDNKNPKIEGSGMMSGGRVLTNLQQYLRKPENSVLLAGIQAEGTRGRKLLEGASELKIYGNTTM